MTHWITTYFLATLVFVFTCTPVLADHHEEEASEDVYDATAVTVEVEGDEAEDSSSIEVEIENNLPESNGDGHSTENVIDSINIDNSGIQAIFINSNVTIHGGTFNNEMTKNENTMTAAEAEEGDEDDRQSSGRPQQGRPNGPPQQPDKFNELIKDATKSTGLFTTYQREDRSLFMEIDASQFGTKYLINGAINLGVGFALPGDMLASALGSGSHVLYFSKRDNQIEMYRKNMRYTAETPQEELSLQKQYPDSMIASFPVQATNPESGTYLIDSTMLFMQDYFQTAQTFAMMGLGRDQNSSYIKDVKTLPENIVVNAFYTYRGGNESGLPAAADGRSVPLEIVYNIQKLQENPSFLDREADFRIGYFLEAQATIGNDTEPTEFIRRLAKWDIRKASPELDMSPPAKPLVLWLQNNIPMEYRKPIREGILEWNKAFAKIGIKDPIVVKDQPMDADWDAADTRYNMVHWLEGGNAGFSGRAQLVSDPRSGEIYAGGFHLQGDTVRSLVNMRRYREPDRAQMLRETLEQRSEAFQYSIQKSRPAGKNRLAHAMEVSQLQQTLSASVCSYADGLADQYATVMTMQAAHAGISKVTGETLDKFIYQFLFAVSCHEMGHVLGLRHNFKGSTLHPLSDVYNAEKMNEIGVTSSVMDYVPIIFSPEGVEQGNYAETTIGPYDYLAIEYGYTQDGSEENLNRIAEMQELDRYVYGTDEDRIIGLDPYANTFDLSNDPLAYSIQQAELYRVTIPKLTMAIDEGDDYSLVRTGFTRLAGQYFSTVTNAITHLGGMYINRVKKGGEYDTKDPIEPISPAKQREALNFILGELLDSELFDIDPEILTQQTEINWYHWGSGMQLGGELQITYFYENYIEIILANLFNPATLIRVQNIEKHRHEQAVQFTLPELFGTTSDMIWAEVLDTDSVDSSATYSNSDPMINTFRRVVQRKHLMEMTSMALEPFFGTPEDARTLAWMELEKIESALDAMLSKAESMDVDDYTLAHLKESHAKVKRALDARLSVRVDFW